MMIDFFKNMEKIKKSLILFISFLCGPVIISVTVIFIIYRSLINLILKYQFGDKFQGLLEGLDVQWTVKDLSKGVMNCVHIVETDNIDKVTNIIKTNFVDTIKNSKFEKLLYTRHKLYGYSFWKRDPNFEPTTVIKSIQLPDISGLEMEDLKQLISEYNNKDLPKNNTISFELIIIKNPIILNNIKTNQFALIFRFQHALFDINSVERFFTEFYKVKKEINEIVPSENISKITQFKNLAKTVFRLKVTPYFLLAQFFINQLLTTRCKHSLYGPKLTETKFLRWKSNQISVNMMKTIQENIPNSTFTTIILTALSESVAKYFLNKSQSIPDTIQILYPSNTNRLIPFEIQSKMSDNETEIKNDFTMETIKLPIFCDGKNTKILNRLNIVKDTVNHFDYSYLVCYGWWKIAAKYFPYLFAKFIRENCNKNEFGFSNYIDSTIGYSLNQYPIIDSILFVPNGGIVGIGFSCVGYKESLNFGLIADKVLISSETDVDEILDNLILCIQNLHKEIINKNC